MTWEEFKQGVDEWTDKHSVLFMIALLIVICLLTAALMAAIFVPLKDKINYGGSSTPVRWPGVW